MRYSPNTPPRLHIFRGMVVDPTRAPLAAAVVTAVDTANKAVFTIPTDSAGDFALQGLSPGVLYLVTVSKPGFVALGTRATLRPATDTLDLDVMLANDTMTAQVPPPTAPPRIRGTVVDSMRTPLAAAVVTAVDSATNKAIFEVRTDSAGRFTFDRLAAGVPYLITARRIGSLEDTSRATLHPGDTLNLPFVLAPISVLTPVRVTAKTPTSIFDSSVANSIRSTTGLLGLTKLSTNIATTTKLEQTASASV